MDEEQFQMHSPACPLREGDDCKANIIAVYPIERRWDGDSHEPNDVFTYESCDMQFCFAIYWGKIMK